MTLFTSCYLYWQKEIHYKQYMKIRCIMHKQIILLLFVFSVSCITLVGQNQITGMVVDQVSHQPIEYASVYINESSKGCYNRCKRSLYYQ